MDLRALWHRLVPPPAALPRAAEASRTDNAILDWLDAAGLPWRDTRAELAARYGLRTDNPYRWELVVLDVDPPPLAGLLGPFGFQAFPRYSPKMPPATLSAHVFVADDAEANIGAAAAQFAPMLGARRITDEYNTRMVQWRSGAASVRLIAWPPSRQTGRLDNPAHRRDPRLVTACHVTVQTGWRPPLSDQDLAWLDGFVRIGATRNWVAVRPRAPLDETMFAETQLEFMRRLPADVDRFRGSFGLSADGEALIFCEDAFYLIPLSLIAGVYVVRTLPAKGGGGSTLNVRCQTGYAACPTKDVAVAQGERADDLNDVAATLAAAMLKPLQLGAYDYDV